VIDKFIDATVVVPTLGRVEQSDALHRKLHDLKPAPIKIIFVFQRNIEWEEFTKLSACGENCSMHINEISVVAARNAGLNAAQTKFVAFIDDDCSPANNNWLEELIQPLDKTDAALTTGPVFGWSSASGNLPFVKRAFLLLPPFLEPIGKTDSEISARASTVAGGNFCARRAELKAVGGFSHKFSSPSLYEETEMAMRISRTMDKGIWFNANAGIVHDQNLQGGMRNTNSEPVGSFIVSQRRILLQSVYGISKTTNARIMLYRVSRFIISLGKTIKNKSGAMKKWVG